ncbi:helix-turn-helix domain-containing protein [Streptomyces sp. NPDC001508]|uniref:helix-turn-helix domain-containing protein n=1 Tax=Streptomyces sp. NPDC001508 TaxID=3154656 RepID=UPI00332DCE29
MDAGRPVAHAAAEAGISRRCLAKWYARWCAHGEAWLVDPSSRPATSPARTGEDVADLIEALRRQTKHGPARLAAHLQRLHGITVAPTTVHRVLVRRGLNRLRDLDPPSGEQLREAIRYEHDYPGELVHVDIKKLGCILAGGGWRMHGHGTDAARAPPRPATPSTTRQAPIALEFDVGEVRLRVLDVEVAAGSPEAASHRLRGHSQNPFRPAETPSTRETACGTRRGETAGQ